MKRQYLHLSAYLCNKCQGPVITGSLAVRESEISKETEIRQVGAVCLACGNKQNKVTEPGVARHFPPVEWESMNLIEACPISTASAEVLSRAELH
ncbi:MAG: hypothetical protein DMG70_01890 [Acidobacteria bacterium]|nr:MAG: hypothetical protein DMG70_01890 [Acidobacteriota bacterium]PYY10872.1 MAG: hypothetical protein DMG69_05415 [Acidobacteriota bacterium]